MEKKEKILIKLESIREVIGDKELSAFPVMLVFKTKERKFLGRLQNKSTDMVEVLGDVTELSEEEIDFLIQGSK